MSDGNHRRAALNALIDGDAAVLDVAKEGLDVSVMRIVPGWSKPHPARRRPFESRGKPGAAENRLSKKCSEIFGKEHERTFRIWQELMA